MTTTLTSPSTTTTAVQPRRRRGLSRPIEGLVPCDHCRGTGETPADSFARTIARNRGQAEPTEMGCPACRTPNGSTGSRRPSDQRAHPYVVPDYVPSSWYEAPDRDAEPQTTTWPHWGEPRRTSPETIAEIVALIREGQARRRTF